MLTPSLLILLASSGLIEARSVHEVRHLHNRVIKRADSTVLSPNAIQSGSFVDGSTQIGANEANQAKSLTSTNNFINNCAGKTLTNGLQITTGSCNGITMGDIPAKTNMVSSMVIFPPYGSATIQSDTTFNISVQVSNLVAGHFTNADATYYAAPQQLQGGIVVGHTHVTVQDLGANLNPTTAPDPTLFSFFKGINDAGNGDGLLQATVTGGLPAGNYRVCTLSSAANHQPVLMPVAQRGSADDCTKFSVIGDGTTINAAANDGANGIAAAALAASAVAAGPGFVVSSSASSSSAASSTDVGKAVSSSAVASASIAPFTNTTTTARGGNGGKGGKDTTTTSLATTKASGGKGGNGGKGQSTSVSEVSTSTEASTISTEASSTGNGGGKAVVTGTKASSAVSSKPTGKRIITIIETFFVFEQARGGSCPAVSKSGNQFNVLEELFDDLASAAAAACGHQFTACSSFSGDGFSVEECASQKDDCSAVATTQSATATAPSTITASVTLPISASATDIPGSIVATQTIAPSSVSVSSAEVTSTSIAGAGKDVATESSQAAQTTPAAVVDSGSAASSSLCSIVTGTVTVDAPAETSSSVSVISTSSAPFSNGTATVSSSSASSSGTVSTVSSSSAIGGIEAPPIVNTGDATRPFSVNGNTFVNEAAAIQRSCDVQFNACANAVNGGKLSGVTLADCSTQETTCEAQ